MSETNSVRPAALSERRDRRRHQRLPVRRIFCVGLNYAAHAREMGKDPGAEPPFFFSKPADAVVVSGSVIPDATSDPENLHHPDRAGVGDRLRGARI